jgi:hypothetical protein
MKMRENDVQSLVREEFLRDLKEKDRQILQLQNNIKMLDQERKRWDLDTRQKLDAILREKVIIFTTHF